MKKNIYIGDIHGLTTWKAVVATHPDADSITFVGDYFDCYGEVTALDQINNLAKIIDFKESFSGTVNLLIGNHDHHYWPGVGNTSKGYQIGAAPAITYFMDENKEHFLMACLVGNVLCTHAGVSPIFLRNIEWDGVSDIVEFLNDTFKYRPRSFIFDGNNRYGDDPQQTCIWIRPRSLQFANSEDTVIKKKYIQVVGHTQQNTIDIKGKSTGGRYYYIDTLSVGQYLIEEDGKFRIGLIS